MHLIGLLPILNELPAFREILSSLADRRMPRASVLQAAKPYLIASLFRQTERPILVLTGRPERGRELYSQLIQWLGEAAPVHLLPAPTSLPYEDTPSDSAVVQQRLRALESLRQAGERPALIVAPVAAVMPKTITPEQAKLMRQTIRESDTVEPDALMRRWVEMGYRWERQVQEPGTMTRRGGIIDIFPPTNELPGRLEFLGDRIESLRLFEPETQRSVRLILSLSVGLATEEAASRAAGAAEGCLLDHLPPQAILLLEEPQEIENAAADLEAQAAEVAQSRIDRGQMSPERRAPYFTWHELQERMEPIARIALQRWEEALTDIIMLPFESAPSYGGQLRLLITEMAQRRRDGSRLVIVSHQAPRLSGLLADRGIIVAPLPNLESLPETGSITLVQGSLKEGWALQDAGTILLTDAEAFGYSKQLPMLRRKVVRPRYPLVELSPGDYVVHIEHGIARFAGMVKLSMGDVEREYLQLEYAAGDKLYVPTDQVDRVTAYVGPEGDEPALSRLGTQEWARAKERVKKATQDIAADLIQLYAARQEHPGIAFPPDTAWQQEMEASFPYVETEDQLQAVVQVKADMEESRPMDRLVCGDVGYGKTEIAVRAAFKAVMGGAQVAILVPTTVLVQQHYSTFSERLKAFPVTVDVLNRFRSDKEQRQTIDRLARGTVDIVIGTHRLLQKDISFKNLGLLIIDEEQRFGVGHKERLKQMRREVDVLALSATPIPRTLYMSLTGVRDMSAVDTAPEDRLPIRTYVTGWDDRIVGDAIRRELDRGGQVFFVHNRVHNIASVAYKVMELAPAASVAVGHGQMTEDELEQVMMDFVSGKVQVLVCTTIIESGLDIPNANTIIINEADKLGLAQLYQLRGRVGRGPERAHAFLLYDREKPLTETAQKRLQAIFEATELGAGFQIAMKDLEIRGAGNLLGEEQSGQIGAVGFELYTRLLAEAVAELRMKEGETPAKPLLPPAPPVDIPLTAYLPDDYITEPGLRLSIYERLIEAARVQEVDEMEQELRDRFGPLPEPAKNLLYIVRVRLLAGQAKLEAIAREDQTLILKTGEVARPNRAHLHREFPHGVRVGPTQVRLDMRRLDGKWRETLQQVLKAMVGV